MIEIVHAIFNIPLVNVFFSLIIWAFLFSLIFNKDSRS